MATLATLQRLVLPFLQSCRVAGARFFLVWYCRPTAVQTLKNRTCFPFYERDLVSPISFIQLRLCPLWVWPCRSTASETNVFLRCCQGDLVWPISPIQDGGSGFADPPIRDQSSKPNTFCFTVGVSTCSKHKLAEAPLQS